MYKIIAIMLFMGYELGNGVALAHHSFAAEFDIKKPIHCSKDNSCGQDDIGVPLFVIPDVSRVSGLYFAYFI